MAYDVEGKLKAILGTIADKPEFEEEVIKLLCEAIQDQGPKAEKFFRLWCFNCHPDKSTIKDFKFEGDLIITAKTMNEVNHKLNSFLGFLKLLTKADSETRSTQKDKDNVTAIEDFEHLISDDSRLPFYDDPNFPDLTIPVIIKKEDENKISDTFEKNAFVGTLEQWATFKMGRIIYRKMNELIKYEASKEKAYDEIKLQIDKNFHQSIKVSYTPKKATSNQTTTNEFLIRVLDSVYNNGVLKEPVVAWLAPDVASIKYHVKVAIRECERVFNANYINKNQIYTIRPVGFLGKYQSANPNEYYQYQITLMLWHILYADPLKLSNYTASRAIIRSMATQEQINKRYQLLQEILNDGASPELLSPYGLNKKLLNLLNKKASKTSDQNWLKEKTNWLYAQGQQVLIGAPWQCRNIKIKKTMTFRPYPLMYASKRNDIYNQRLTTHPQTKKIKKWTCHLQQFIKHLPILLILPILATLLVASVLNTLGIVSLHYIKLYLTNMSYWADVLCWANMLYWTNILLWEVNFIFHAFVEGALNQFAKQMKPVNIHIYNAKYSYLRNQFIAQILTPLKRILFSPLDEMQEHRVWHRIYLLRVLIGISLTTLASITFALDGLVFSLNLYFYIGIYSLFNTLYDISQISKWLFKKTKPEFEITTGVKFTLKTESRFATKPESTPILFLMGNADSQLTSPGGIKGSNKDRDLNLEKHKPYFAP